MRDLTLARALCFIRVSPDNGVDALQFIAYREFIAYRASLGVVWPPDGCRKHYIRPSSFKEQKIPSPMMM